MTYQVETTSAALRQIKKLPRDVQPAIVAAVEALATNPRPNGVKKLKGEENAYRIRVRDYRILYEIHDEELIILVVKVGTRSSVYRE